VARRAPSLALPRCQKRQQGRGPNEGRAVLIQAPSPVANSGNGGGSGRGLLSSLCLTLALCACSTPREPNAAAAGTPRLVALSADECVAVLGDDAPPETLRQAILRSLEYLQRLPPDRELPAVDQRVRVADLVALLNALMAAGDHDAQWRQRVCDRVRLYRVAAPSSSPGSDDMLLLTGYYQPELVASRSQTERFRYPLYRAPDDLIDVDLGRYCAGCAGKVAQGRVLGTKLVPYYTRAEIDGGVLAGKDYEIAWLDDPVEAFFLQIQGSGRLRFDDGVLMDVSYGGSNGLPYTSIGRVLIDQGKMAREGVSLQSLKAYLRTHPDEQASLMAANERYIFFRTVAVGPIGSLGVPLTAGRSLAADASVYPAGAPVLLTVTPRKGSSTTAPVRRVVLIQDAGVAIVGPRRLDMYWGTGSEVEALAGGMRDPAEMYLMLPP